MRFALIELDDRNVEKILKKGTFSVIDLPRVYGHQFQWVSEEQVKELKKEVKE